MMTLKSEPQRRGRTLIELWLLVALCVAWPSAGACTSRARVDPNTRLLAFEEEAEQAIGRECAVTKPQGSAPARGDEDDDDSSNLAAAERKVLKLCEELNRGLVDDDLEVLERFAVEHRACSTGWLYTRILVERERIDSAARVIVHSVASAPAEDARSRLWKWWGVNFGAREDFDTISIQLTESLLNIHQSGDAPQQTAVASLFGSTALSEEDIKGIRRDLEQARARVAKEQAKLLEKASRADVERFWILDRKGARQIGAKEFDRRQKSDDDAHHFQAWFVSPSAEVKESNATGRLWGEYDDDLIGQKMAMERLARFVDSDPFPRLIGPIAVYDVNEKSINRRIESIEALTRSVSGTLASALIFVTACESTSPSTSTEADQRKFLVGTTYAAIQAAASTMGRLLEGRVSEDDVAQELASVMTRLRECNEDLRARAGTCFAQGVDTEQDRRQYMKYQLVCESTGYTTTNSGWTRVEWGDNSVIFTELEEELWASGEFQQPEMGMKIVEVSPQSLVGAEYERLNESMESLPKIAKQCWLRIRLSSDATYLHAAAPLSGYAMVGVWGGESEYVNLECDNEQSRERLIAELTKFAAR